MKTTPKPNATKNKSGDDPPLSSFESVSPDAGLEVAGGGRVVGDIDVGEVVIRVELPLVGIAEAVAEAVADATAEVSIEVPVSATCLATARAPSNMAGLT